MSDISSKDLGLQFVAASGFGFNYNPNGDAFLQQYLQQTQIEPRRNFIEGMQSGQNYQAWNIGDEVGRVNANNMFGGDQARFNNSVMEGRHRALSDYGYNLGMASVGQPYYDNQSSYYQDPYYNPASYSSNPGGGLVRTNGGGGQTMRGAPPEQPRAIEDSFGFQNGRKQYFIENAGIGLNRNSAGAIERAIVGIDTNWKDKIQLEHIKEALDAGLNPYAKIRIGNSGPVSFEQFVRANTDGKEEKEALALVEAARKEYDRKFQAAEQQQQDAQQGRIPLGSAIPDANTPEARANFGQMVKANVLYYTDAEGNEVQLTPMERTNLVQQILNTAKGNEQHQEEIANSILRAGVTAADLQRAGVKLDGLTEADKAALDNVLKATQEQRDAAMQSYESKGFGRDFSTDDLRAIRLKDEALQSRLDKAIEERQRWDNLAKENPLVGMILMLFRPLIEAMNPGSDPESIIAEAADRRVIETAPESVTAWLTELGKSTEGIAAPTPAATAEPTPAAAPAQPPTDSSKDAPAPAATAATASTEGEIKEGDGKLSTAEIKAFEAQLVYAGVIRSHTVNGTLDKAELDAIKKMGENDKLSADAIAAVQAIKKITIADNTSISAGDISMVATNMAALSAVEKAGQGR